MKPEEALTMEKLLNELQSVDTVKLVLTRCGESIYDSREVYESIRPFVEKQIPKKPIESEFTPLICPYCEAKILLGQRYCENCGQAIDWGNEE